MRAIIAASVLAAVLAECPNGCSAHGICKAKDTCQCDPNYMGADCSQRVCPFDYAFVDTPRGDLNHNGGLDYGVSDISVQFSNSEEYETFPVSASEGEAHFYAECSGKGDCDRASGACKCYAGYTGSACQRTACPSDCSGHGVCRTVREIADGELNKREQMSIAGHKWYTGVRSSFEYNQWDADKVQACVCDPGFAGVDCSQRQCPRGDDPITTGSRWCGGSTCTWEKQQFTLSADGATTYRIGFTDSLKVTHYAYATVDVSNDPNGYVADQTVDLPGPSTVAGKIMNALREVPGGVLQRVEVYAKAAVGGGAGADARTFVVTFVGVSGAQDNMDITVASGGPGNLVGGVTKAATGNYEGIECSARGNCDGTSGLCKCFTGYFGAACEFQNALAGGSGGVSTGAAAAAASAATSAM